MEKLLRMKHNTICFSRSNAQLIATTGFYLLTIYIFIESGVAVAKQSECCLSFDSCC